MIQILKAPFPWFGGKSRAASLVWERFGDCANYIEPFFGSGAVLLGRPGGASGIETVNDKDCLVSNFWRALQNDPDAVADFADHPVNEADLTAVHTWLVNQSGFQERMKTDPDYFDAKIAGWWVWGISQWIGSGWCGQLPHLGNPGTGVHRHREELCAYMEALADRMRYVRVCCGDWARICGPSPTFKNGLTGVFLDPPYSADTGRDMGCYSIDDGGVANDVRIWALENGDNPLLRIALCGYESEHQMPSSWECVPWKAHGGYGSQGNGNGRANSRRERIWFSPHCLGVELFRFYEHAANSRR
jgi:DNA adenine methylase